MRRSWEEPASRARAVTIALAVVLTVLVGATVASGHRVSNAAADINHLTWGLGAPIRGLDYTQSADSGSATVISLGCETLVRYDKSGALIPDLADSFSTPNSTTYVYHVRSGVKFWDGHPLTTADVLYSLQQAASKAGGSQIAAFFTSVQSMKATGPSTITIKLKSPDPYFRYTPADTYILEKSFWQKNGKKVGTPGTLTMCTGPFRFTSFVPDDRVDSQCSPEKSTGRSGSRRIRSTSGGESPGS